MIEKYTVRSYMKMPSDPASCLELVDEDYYNTIDKCKEWCREQFDIKDLNFEIHHSLGAKNYLLGIGSGTGLVTWLVREYTEHNYPTVRPWWDLYEIPPEVDSMCQGIKF